MGGFFLPAPAVLDGVFCTAPAIAPRRLRGHTVGRG